MNDLNKYYTLLFKEAHRFDNIHFSLEICLIALLILSNYIGGYWLYTATVVGLLIQIGSFATKKQQHRKETLAHRLAEYAMLYSTFKKETFTFDVSQVKGALGNSLHKKVSLANQEPESSNYLVDDSNKNALLLMIQENAFWNHHLYAACFRLAIIKLLIPVIGIVLAIVLGLGTDLVDQQFLLPRILIALLTANIIFNQIDTVLKWQSGSKEMLALDNSISRQKEQSEDFWMHTFAWYNIIKTSTPLISESMYNKHRSKLNDAWKTRFVQLYGTGQ